MIEFENTDYYTGPSATEDMIEVAQERLGVALPKAYLDLVRRRNGGKPVRRCYPTSFPSTWAQDHIAIRAIYGIGGESGVDVISAHMVAEWDYPDIGVVICVTPSGGHDTVMLDYTTGRDEPSVAYVDEDRVPRLIADSFAEFLANLVDCGSVGNPVT